MSLLTENARPKVSTATSAKLPIDRAREYVYISVQVPALASALDPGVKSKVRHSNLWLERFKRIGDLLAYLKRFNVSHDDPIYKEMKKWGLLTFEDIVGEFERKFEHWADDCSRIDDFVIGEEYSVFDILILARSYDTRSGGMFVLEAAGKPVAVVIKATLSNGQYANVWVKKHTLLKYYLKSIKGKFGEHFKPNKAIIENEGIPVVTFVRESKAEPFIFRGIFQYQQIVHDEDNNKAFILSKSTQDQLNLISTSQSVAADLEKSVADALSSSQAQRLARLAHAPKKPTVIKVVTKAFARNADVIAEVLIRAGGACEACGKPAPFLRRSDNTPYLEVHHRVPLANDGDDSVDNALALCPNCHREFHYGQPGMNSSYATSATQGLDPESDPLEQSSEFIE